MTDDQIYQILSEYALEARLDAMMMSDQDSLKSECMNFSSKMLHETNLLPNNMDPFQINMDELLPMAIDTQNIISTLLYLDQLIPLIIECRPSGKTYMMFQAGILDEFLSEWKEMKSKRVHGLISEEQYKQWENMFLQKE